MAGHNRHHYIPMFILNRFVNDRGLLYVHDRRDPQSRIRQQSPKDSFVEKHLYSRKNHDGAWDRSLEERLAGLEGDAAEVIRRIVEGARAGMVARLSSDERAVLDFFVWMQWRRIPELHDEHITDEAIEAEIIRLAKEYENDIRPMTAAERKWVENPSQRRHFRQNVIVDTLARTEGRVLPTLATRGISVVSPSRPRQSFVIGSRPVIRMGPPNATLAEPDTELWTVLAPDVALSYFRMRGEDRFARLSDKGTRVLNERISGPSSIIVSRSADLILSLRPEAVQN